MEDDKIYILIQENKIKMNHRDGLNFNQSLLYYSLCQSEQNCFKSTFQKKSSLGLLNELNMTYSRLTMDNKYDCAKESPLIRSEVQQRFQPRQAETNKQLDIVEVERCKNCKRVKRQLNTVEIFLEQTEKKLVQKEMLLANRFKQVTLQLTKKNEQAQDNQQMYQKTLQQLNSLKKSKKLPKCYLNNSEVDDNRKKKFQDNINLSTMQSTFGFQNRRLTQYIKKRSNHLSQPDQQNLADQIKQISTLKPQDKSNTTTILFEFSSSEADQDSQIIESHGFKSIDTNRKTSLVSRFAKTNDGIQNSSQKDFELSKLRFENTNLKSYNAVLLNHIKPKSLACKVFSSYRN